MVISFLLGNLFQFGIRLYGLQSADGGAGYSKHHLLVWDESGTLVHKDTPTNLQLSDNPTDIITAKNETDMAKLFQDKLKSERVGAAGDENTFVDKVTLWTIHPNLTEVLRDQPLYLIRAHQNVGLYQLLDILDVRQCRQNPKNGSAVDKSTELPLCPSENSTQIGFGVPARQSTKFEYQLMKQLDSMGRVTSSWFSIQSITYSDSSERTRLLYTKSYSHRPYYCQADRCPIRCDAGYGWDELDFLCKPLAEYTRPPRRNWGGKCSCGSTCFTPDANSPSEQSAWPWESIEQRQFYTQGTHYTRIENNECRAKRQNEESLPKLRFDCKHDSTNEVQVHCHEHLALQHHVMFIPKANLLMCGIPKVGISEWLKFLRYTNGANDYLALPHFKKDREPFLVGLTWPLEKAQAIFNDPNVTKAVFVRDPAERLLSAYLNKVEGKMMQKTAFKEVPFLEPHYKISFELFVDLVTRENQTCPSPMGLHSCTDPHWRPQILTCALDHYLPYYDFIGSLNHSGKHTRVLLKQAGAWFTFGKTYDNGAGIGSARLSKLCQNQPPQNFRPANFTPAGFNQKGSSADHATAAKKRMEQYYTPTLLEKVKKAYALDYQLWNDVNGRKHDKILSGRELRMVKNHCNK